VHCTFQIQENYKLRNDFLSVLSGTPLNGRKSDNLAEKTVALRFLG
jgi:hypothetical protein